jgi:hypothetical protein
MDPEEIQHIETTFLRHINTPLLFEIGFEPTTIVQVLNLILEKPNQKRCELVFALRVLYQDNPHFVEELLLLNLPYDYYFNWKTLHYVRKIDIYPSCIFYGLHNYFKTKTDLYVLK